MQITTQFGYWEKKPALILKPRVPRSSNAGKRYLITLDQAWMYSEDHYEQVSPKMPPTYQEYIFAKALELYELFDLGSTPTTRQLAEVAWLIMDAIDSLVNMPPYEEMQNMITAEEARVKLSIDGEPVMN